MEHDTANPGNRLPVDTPAPTNGSRPQTARQEVLLGFLQNDLVEQPNGGLSVDDELLASGLIDSIGVVRLVTFVEETFSISIPAEDVIVENFSSIGALDEYLNSRPSD